MGTRGWILGGCLLLLLGCGKSTGSGQAAAATGVTVADLVGTWDMVGSGTVRLPDSSLCSQRGGRVHDRHRWSSHGNHGGEGVVSERDQQRFRHGNRQC